MICQIFVFLAIVAASWGQGLPLLNINPNTITTSGVSAGACMAVQFEIAYSALVKAGGIVAGLPYQASGGTLPGALMAMNDPLLAIDVPSLVSNAQTDDSLGLIDALVNVANHTIYLFGGLFDSLVNHQCMVDVQNMYQLLGVTKMVAYFNYSAEHAWITNSYGNDCSYLGAPYINNCGLDFAGNFLAAALTDLGVRWNTTRGKMSVGSIVEFSQAQYGASWFLNSLADRGYLYIPAQCANQQVQCHLHVAFHGCTMQADSFEGLTFVQNSGLNEWAESNNIIVLYPQAYADLLADNPNACFDWWGFTGMNYAQKSSTQMTIFRKFITALGGF
jgi:hypothetical protein